MDGVRIAYAVSGKGPPLVMTATWLGNIERDWGSPVWQPWFESLSRHFTLIRYDQRGCGLSDRYPAEISFKGWCLDLEAVVNAMNCRQFPLIGISQGSPIAVAYAGQHPERATRLVLLAAYVRGRLKRGKPGGIEEARMLTNLIKAGWDQENPAARQLFTSLLIPGGTPEQHRWMNEKQKSSVSVENAIKILSVIDRVDVTAQASALRVPTLVCHTRGDAAIPFEEGCRTASTIPGARFIPLEGQNHILLDNDPAWKIFSTSLLEFLSTESETRKINDQVNSYGLTRREVDVLDLMAQGIDNNGIADQLFISPRTVRNHITRIFSKLGVSKRPEAIVIAREAGMGSCNTPVQAKPSNF